MPALKIGGMFGLAVAVLPQGGESRGKKPIRSIRVNGFLLSSRPG
jgi:hypothetical protein